MEKILIQLPYTTSDVEITPHIPPIHRRVFIGRSVPVQKYVTFIPPGYTHFVFSLFSLLSVVIREKK